MKEAGLSHLINTRAHASDESLFVREHLSQFNHCYYSNHDDMFLNGLLYVFINNTLSGGGFLMGTHTHTHTQMVNN